MESTERFYLKFLMGACACKNKIKKLFIKKNFVKDREIPQIKRGRLQKNAAQFKIKIPALTAYVLFFILLF